MTNAAEPLSILLIDDDEADWIVIRDLLDRVAPGRYRIDWRDSVVKGLEALESQGHDAVLLDYRTGPTPGTEWLPALLEAGQGAPVILLTGREHTGADNQALTLGARDYLVMDGLGAARLERVLRDAIERKTLLHALSQRDQHYRQLFDANPAASLVYHRDHCAILAANAAAADLYGVATRDLLGRDFLDLFNDPDTQDHDFLAWRDQPDNQRPARLWQHKRADGALLNVELLDTPFEHNGEPARLVMVIDKSHQMRADREARESERLLLQLLDDSLDPIVVTDHQQRLHYANPAAEAVGLCPRRLADQRLPLGANLPDRFEWLWQGSATPLTFEVARSTTRWQGEIMDQLVLRDITRRKSDEEQLRLLGRSLASTRNGVMIVDALQPDRPITYVNPAFETLTGYSESEAIGHNARFLQGEDRDQAGIERIRKALARGREVNVVLRNYHKNGTAFWNDLYIAPVLDDSGVVTHFIGVQNDISKQREYESTLAYNASHDVLTGLPNRALLEDRLQQGLSMARRYQRPLAVLYIDLDDFQAVNDALGHAQGDRLLVQTANRLKNLIRSSDTLARLASDEFVILLPDLTHGQEVLSVAENLLEKLRRPYQLAGQDYLVTASIGIAVSDGEPIDAMQLVREADRAVFQAKQAGRNQFHWFTPELDQNLKRSLQLRSDLPRALENQEFELHFQPQIGLADNQVMALEALVRWRHPKLGCLTPGDFIHLAEKSGQISALSDWVLDAVCQARLALEAAGHRLPIAVNLSPVLFHQDDLPQRMEARVRAHGLDCQGFELEILESMMVSFSEASLDLLHQFRQVGFKLSIDDFGTGFSSLSYLKNLPIQKIKIDRTFIKDLIQDHNDAAIVRAIIAMAHQLGLTVTAEGVEIEAQWAFLRRERCDISQGFLHSRAIDLGGLLDYLKARQDHPTTELGSENGQQRRLLILDDDPHILTSLKRTLRSEPYQTRTCQNTTEAFELLAREPVQVILSDQRMPDMSGTEFLQRVKRLYPETVRMVLSGYTDLNTVTDAINRGAVDRYLTKPWEDDALRQVIAQAFEQAYRQASVP